MVTLASIVIAVPLGVAGGLALGIAAWRWRGVERVISPILDLMQTVPTFAYLVPILVLFGFGPVAALLATMIYAMPPMVRVTLVALRAVPSEIMDFARDGGLHAGPADAQGDAAGGAAGSDGGRQSGHHAQPEHGHHRVDDRGGGPGRGRAGKPAPAGYRRRDRGGSGDHGAGRGAGPAGPGDGGAGGAVERPHGQLAAAPSAHGAGGGGGRGDRASGSFGAGGAGLAEGLGDHDQDLLVGLDEVHQRQLLRPVGGLPGLDAAVSPVAGEAVLPGVPWPFMLATAGAGRLAAGRLAAGVRLRLRLAPSSQRRDCGNRR